MSPVALITYHIWTYSSKTKRRRSKTTISPPKAVMMVCSLGSIDDGAAPPSPSASSRRWARPSGSGGMTKKRRRFATSVMSMLLPVCTALMAVVPVSIAAASPLSSTPELRRAVRPSFLRAEEAEEGWDATGKGQDGRAIDGPWLLGDPDDVEVLGDDDAVVPPPADSCLRYHDFTGDCGGAGGTIRLPLRNLADRSGGGASDIDALTSSLSTLLSQPHPVFALSDAWKAMETPPLGMDGGGDGHPTRELAQSLTSRLRKTGTTIAGCLCDGGTVVVLGADTRATEGTTVADKRCEKLHRLASTNVWCAGAGTSADVDALVRRVRFTFELRGALDGCIGNGRHGATGGGGGGDGSSPPAVVSAVVRCLREELHANGGRIGANLIVGGYEVASGRATLAAVHPHGSVDDVPYSALGSGGLAATAVLESGYRGDLTLYEARELIKRAIVAGIDNDLGSGSQVDLCVIGPDGVSRYDRAVVEEQHLPAHPTTETSEEGEGGEGGDEGQRGGVNGFGSMPYAIKSRRIVMRSEEAEEEDRRRWRRDVLGLPQRLNGDKE